MIDISTTLAADFLSGWRCILVAPQSTSSTVLRPPSTTVILGTIRDREADGSRLWLSRQHAERTLTAFFSRHQEAQRRRGGDGYVVQADVNATEQMIRGVAGGLGYALAGDELIDEQMAMISQRISDALPRVTKGLSKQYKAERASGTPVPAYHHWLAEKLRPAFAGLTC
jgi:hypothetical protein